MGTLSYQKLTCWGDSQTFGARTYGCYPLYLVDELERTTRYRWSVATLATNGYTARDLWFQVNREAPAIRDCYQSCLLIGTNDVTNQMPVELFERYYGQILTTLKISGWKVVHCGEIPPVWADGHAFANRASEARRQHYNEAIQRSVAGCSVAHIVRFPALTAECFVDPLHFSEMGNEIIARAFAESIRNV